MKTKKIKIICEIASAHGGDLSKLKELISAANETNSDYLKLQIFNYESLVAKENKSFSDLRKIELSLDDWHDALTYAEKIETKVILEVYDRKSFAFSNDYNFISGYKIPTADLVDLSFIKEIAAKGKNVFLAIGGANQNEISAAIECFNFSSTPCPVLMHGIQSFPTLLEDSMLNKIKWVENTFKLEVGYADHIDAEESELSRTISCMAVAAGATVIEKHITLNRADKGYDYYSALNPGEFNAFVSHIRKVELALGESSGEILNDAEIEYRNKMKKFAVAKGRIEKGTRLDSVDLIYQRTSHAGLTALQINEKKNLRFLDSIDSGTVLLESMIG
jgi:N,N'-diacetyllegionaminate synthase